MSYALAFTADSRYDFAQLPVPLQELALDELDRVADSDPPRSGTFVRDLMQDSVGQRDYLFLHLAVDRSQSAILVLGVHHHVRPMG